MRFIKAKWIQILGFIVLVSLGVFLYFYKLSEVPPGFYIDEALPGYNAFSLLKTGKDEYGKSFPLVFRFYGSFNPPIFTYLTAFSVAVFGVSVFAVRFPSALLGMFSAIVVYFILRKSNFTKDRFTAIVGALFALISPWLILHSRVGYEVSTAFFLFSAGVLLAWLSLKESKFLIWSFLFLSLSTYAAYTQRFIVPFFILALLVVFKSKFFKGREKVRKNLILALGIAFLTQIPNFYLLTTPAFFPKSDLLSTGIIEGQAQKIANFLPYALSFILSFVREVFSQYFSYFSPRSLFFLPDPDLQRSIPELSTFYFWMIIPYIFGVYLLWKNKSHDFIKFLLILALITPIPASLTKNPFSTHRALPLFLPLILIITLGYERIVKNFPSGLKSLVTLGLIALSLLLLWRSYFVLLPHERATAWGYGVKELAEIIKERPDTIFVIDQTRTKPLYMQLAFFLKFPPEKFQAISATRIRESYYEEVEFNLEYKFANIETRNIFWEEDIYIKQILTGDTLTISEDQAREHFLEKVFEIKGPLDEVVFVGYETNPQKKCESINFENEQCSRF